MPWIDLFIIAVLLISTVLSYMRGFAKDAVSLTAWILAFVIAISLGDKFALILPQSIEDPRVRLGISVTVLFIATLVIGIVANFLLAGFINMAKLGNLDRSLGVLFGFVRGIVIVSLLVVLGAFIDLNQTGWWQRSALLPLIENLIGYILPLLPDNLARFIKL
jgi:membrane protein required for colicin V production